MPFPMIPAALCVGFLLVWALIGGMIFRDSHLAVANERDAGVDILPSTTKRQRHLRSMHTRHLRGGRQQTARAAS
jgi:hypothetical protein